MTFASLMAALSNIFSMPPFVIPIAIGGFETQVHFTQLPIFLSGILVGPWAGLLTGAVGGLYMSFVLPFIPFIVGGLALLGYFAGLFAKRMKLRPWLASILAWCIQAPYVFVSDYLWFASFRQMSPTVALATVSTILIKLTVEAVVASALAEVVVAFIKRSGFHI